MSSCVTLLYYTFTRKPTLQGVKMKATTIIGGIALGAVGLVAKKWLDGEVEKARELYGDDYTVTETLLDKVESGLYKAGDALDSFEEKVENTFDKIESELTGQEVDHHNFKVDENTNPETVKGFCDGINSVIEPLSNNLHSMAMEEKEQELQSAKDEIARLQEQIAKLQGSNQNI